MAAKKVCIYTINGMIGSTIDADGKPVVDRSVSDAFNNDIGKACNSIKTNWDISVNIEEKSLLHYVDASGNTVSGKDSTNLGPEDWQEIISAIANDYDKYDGFIIIHGTNTMGYTAAALSFAFCNLTKPIVLTGSQVPYAIPGSDAMLNLENALRVAVYPPSKSSLDGKKSDIEYAVGLKGVFAVIGSHIISGCRVKKFNDSDYDAIKTFNFKTGIGRIGRFVKINKEGLDFHNKYFGVPQSEITNDLADRRNEEEIDVRNVFDTRIASFTEFPGMKWDLFKAAVEVSGAQGIVFRAYGAADSNEGLLEGFRWLKEKRIPCVMTTQAPEGIANMQVNEPGKKLFDDLQNDVIPAWDMSIECMTVKMAWLLANETDEDPAVRYCKIVWKMSQTLRGEKEPLPSKVKDHLFNKLPQGKLEFR